MKFRGDYRDWIDIDYRPVVTAHYPEALIDELPERASIVEIGCHDGIVSRWLARRRPDAVVHGIDVNFSAIVAARRRAVLDGLQNVTFHVGDATQHGIKFLHDAVITIRVLTCLPDERDWCALVGTVRQMLAPAGAWYAVDYLLDESNPAYGARYAAATDAGWRRGNFRVDGATGDPLFIAHHHTEEELQCLIRSFRRVRVRRFDSLSMNGNHAAMFEFIGHSETES